MRLIYDAKIESKSGDFTTENETNDASFRATPKQQIIIELKAD